MDAFSVREAERKTVVAGHDRSHGDAAKLDVERPQLSASDPQQLIRWETFAGQKVVYRVGTGVPRLPFVTNQYAAPTSAEDERGTQAGGTAADDDDVEHRGADRHTIRPRKRGHEPVRESEATIASVANERVADSRRTRRWMPVANLFDYYTAFLFFFS